MIGWLRGVVVDRDPAGGLMVLDVGGVGYELNLSLQTFAQVPEAGQACTLFVHTHVREDALVLFGFSSPHERRLFRMLTSVPKVGPKHAIGVLGGFPLDELVDGIQLGESKKLQKIPGIGKKLADQIVLSLQDKVGELAAVVGRPGTPAVEPEPPSESEILEEAAETLVAWGFRAKQAQGAVEKVDAEAQGEQLTLEELLRRSMRLLTD